MAAPTFVAEYEGAWNSSTSPKTASVTAAAGDVLVVGAISADAGTVPSTPTGGTGITWSLFDSYSTASNTGVRVWTTTVASGQTFTLSVAKTGNNDFYGFNCLRFSGSSGIGPNLGRAQTTGAPSASLTTTGANSAIVVFNGDFNAVDGTTRTWRTVNGFTPSAGNGQEVTYFRDSLWYGVYGAYYPDAGAIGAKTVGLSAPAGQKYSLISVEVLGSGGAAAVSDPPLYSPRHRLLPILTR